MSGERLTQPDTQPSASLIAKRGRMFALIDAIERDLRDLLVTWVSAELSEEELIRPFAEVVEERRRRDRGRSEGEGDLVEYLHLGETLSLLNIYRNHFSNAIASSIRDSTSRLESLVPIRNRVMHGRPLLQSDPDQAIRVGVELEQSDLPLPTVRAVLATLRSDPAWNPIGELVIPEESVLHNLPEPEFDETGFIGRDKESSELRRMLLSRRFPVLTVIGPGGVGKTALAVKVLYEVIDDESCPYDAVLWTSLKLEAFTAAGLRQLREPLGDLGEVGSELVGAIDEDFEGNIEETAAVLDGISALIVIDNIETESADEVIELVERFPEDTRFLFTSRVGLGQLERRVPLSPMSERESLKLLRIFSQRRAVEQLRVLPEETLKQIVSELHQSPLAIKWYVQAVESGKGVDIYIEGQEDLLRFCVQSVVEALSENARAVAHALYLLPSNVSLAELAVHTDTPVDDLRRALHELQRASIVVANARFEGQLVDTFELTETALAYFGRVESPPPEKIAELKRRRRQYLQSEERRQVDSVARSLSPNAVDTSEPSEKPVAALLRQALLKNRAREHEEADALVEKARRLAPRYFEVPRTQGFMASTRGELEAASMYYEQALELADGEQKARVSYYYAGHLTRACRDPLAALPRAQFAYETLSVPETAILLGQIHVYTRHFDEGEALLREAVDESEGKLRLIAVTQLVSAATRRSEYQLTEERNPKSALKSALAAIQVGAEEIDRGVRDQKLLREVDEAISEATRAAAGANGAALDQSDLKQLIDWMRIRPRWGPLGTQWQYIRGHLGRLVDSGALTDQMVSVVRADIGLPSFDLDSEVNWGTISRYYGDRRYGFINPDDRELGRVYVHESALDTKDVGVLLTPDARVSFRSQAGKEGHRATQLSLPDSHEQLQARLEERTATIVHVAETYLIAQDELTSSTVLIHGRSMKGSYDLSDLQDGDRVRMTIEFGERGLTAKEGSTRPV